MQCSRTALGIQDIVTCSSAGYVCLCYGDRKLLEMIGKLNDRAVRIAMSLVKINSQNKQLNFNALYEMNITAAIDS